jgi:hypothetical protein
MTDNTNAERQARFRARQRDRLAKLEQQVRLLQRAAAAPQIDPAPLDNKLRADLAREAVKHAETARRKAKRAAGKKPPAKKPPEPRR